MLTVTIPTVRDLASSRSERTGISWHECERAKLKTEGLKRFWLGWTAHKVEELGQGRLVKIAHWRVAPWLDPFGMLSPQVMVNLLLELAHGLDPIADQV